LFSGLLRALAASESASSRGDTETLEDPLTALALGMHGLFEPVEAQEGLLPMKVEGVVPIGRARPLPHLRDRASMRHDAGRIRQTAWLSKADDRARTGDPQLGKLRNVRERAKANRDACAQPCGLAPFGVCLFRMAARAVLATFWR
jgi:hypothetical protein